MMCLSVTLRGVLRRLGLQRRHSGSKRTSHRFVVHCDPRTPVASMQLLVRHTKPAANASTLQTLQLTANGDGTFRLTEVVQEHCQHKHASKRSVHPAGSEVLVSPRSGHVLGVSLLLSASASASDVQVFVLLPALSSFPDSSSKDHDSETPVPTPEQLEVPVAADVESDVAADLQCDAFGLGPRPRADAMDEADMLWSGDFHAPMRCGRPRSNAFDGGYRGAASITAV